MMNKTVSIDRGIDETPSFDSAQDTVDSECVPVHARDFGQIAEGGFNLLWREVNDTLPEDNTSLDVRDTGISREITQKYIVRIEVNSFLKIYDYRVATRKAFGNVTGWFWWNPDTCEEMTNVTHWTPIVFIPSNI